VNRVCLANREDRDSKAFQVWKEPMESKESSVFQVHLEREETRELEWKEEEERREDPEDCRVLPELASMDRRDRKVSWETEDCRDSLDRREPPVPQMCAKTVTRTSRCHRTIRDHEHTLHCRNFLRSDNVFQFVHSATIFIFNSSFQN